MVFVLYRKFTAILIIVLILHLCVVALAHAHLIGASYEEEKAGYLIDVGYNPEFPRAGERVRFDYILYQKMDEGGWNRVEFTDVWVNISKENRVFFAGGIHYPRFGAPGATYVLPEDGEYMISVRYQDEGERIIDTTFPFTIYPANDGDVSDDLDVETVTFLRSVGSVLFLLGVFAGVQGYVLYYKIRRRSHDNQ